MKGFFKVLGRTFAIVIVGIVVVITLFATGIIEKPVLIDTISGSHDAQTSQTKPVSSDNKTSTTSTTPEVSDNDIRHDERTETNTTISISTTDTSKIDEKYIPSALSIKLSGQYLEAFKKATYKLDKNDIGTRIVIKVGLQILQSKTIIYENDYHYYSLNYSASGNTRGGQFYNLKNCIERINSGKYIYTDCFGFVRLTHSIACYSINSYQPEKVEKLSGLYGYQGSYSAGTQIFSTSIKNGSVIYDTLTGYAANYGTINRHVAIFLYASGNHVVYMDQGGICAGEFTNGYIYSTASSKTPFKFNKFKSYS